MKKIKFLALCAIAAGVVTSCQKEEVTNEVQPEAVVELSKTEKNALLEAGVNPNGATVEMYKNPLDGSVSEVIQSGDIMLDRTSLINDLYKLASGEENTKQYRTNNLVTGGSRTIDILGFTGSGNALTPSMRTGLQWAVNNYNRLNNSLTFRLTFGTNFQAADMVVFNNNAGGAGGSAGFPTGGRPFKFVQINNGTGTFGGSNVNNVNEHVIGHEIGHSIGFRHTDYARRRCGGANEGTAGVGAINIPGTPRENRWGAAGLDSDSLMISCFDGSEDGEFSRFDVVALNALY